MEEHQEQKQEQNQGQEPYMKARSIHIFAWPFVYGRTEEQKKSFLQEIEGSRWKEKSLHFQDYTKEDQKRMAADCFMLEQYLSTSGRELFIGKPGEENDTCKIYTYELEQESVYYIGHNAEKKVVKKEGTEQERIEIRYEYTEYRLVLDQIEMHLYHCGVGILFFHTLNTDPDIGIEDIRWINELGRRVSLPFIPDEPNGYIMTAERLGIISGEQDMITSFRQRVQDYYGVQETATCENPEKNMPVDKDGSTRDIIQRMIEPAEFIAATLRGSLKPGECGELQVEYPADDRMFVFCLIRDEALSKKIKEKEKSRKDQEDLYAILYVDGGDASCQSDRLLEQYLDEAVYRRWEDLGTIHGITDYSWICITDSEEKVQNSVVRPFWVEYKYMVSLAIAQKQGLALFAKAAEQNIRGMDREGLITREQANRLVSIQEEYVSFRNQMMILKLSCQQQGVELYHMLQRQLLIKEETEELDAQLSQMYEAVNVSNGTKLNKWGIRLAVGALAFEVFINFFPNFCECIGTILVNAFLWFWEILK